MLGKIKFFNRAIMFLIILNGFVTPFQPGFANMSAVRFDRWAHQ
jgi:hypothetical protein